MFIILYQFPKIGLEKRDMYIENHLKEYIHKNAQMVITDI